MYLLVTNIAHYLIARGLIEPEAIVKGDLVIAEDGRRNRNFKVLRDSGSGLFLKQVKSFDNHAISTLTREAECYRLANKDQQFAPLARLMPPFIDFDPSRTILVLGLLPQAQNLSQHYLSRGEYPKETGRLLGRELGTCHSEPGMAFVQARHSPAQQRQVPWILSLHLSGETMFPELSGGNNQLVNILRSFPRFTAQLNQLRSEWRYDGLIHGDIKWDNCLLYQQNDETRLCLVDWELADFGDSCWDVGGVFQSYLCSWILNMQTGRAAGNRIEDMQGGIRAFWQAYCAARGLIPAAAREVLLRSVRYAAARMIQTAFEFTHASAQMSGNNRMILQASNNILENPEGACGELLGLYEVGR